MLSWRDQVVKAHLLTENNPDKPRKALKLIDELGLYSTVFTDPTASKPSEPKTTHWNHSYNCLHYMMTDKTSQSIYAFLVYKDAVDGAKFPHGHEEAPLLAWILSALSPWAQIHPQSGVTPKGKLVVPFGGAVAREGIKLPSRICNIVTGAFRNREHIAASKRAVIDKKSWILERDILGMKIRQWERDGGYWRLQVMLAILVEAMDLTHGTGTIIFLLISSAFC